VFGGLPANKVAPSLTKCVCVCACVFFVPVCVCFGRTWGRTWGRVSNVLGGQVIFEAFLSTEAKDKPLFLSHALPVALGLGYTLLVLMAVFG